MAEHPENEEVLAALRAAYKGIVGEVRALRAEVAQLRAAPSAPALPVASDADLDGKYGDEQVKKDPPRWEGDRVAPCRMSECSPEYLDALADFLQWKADNPREGKEKYASYDRKSAARARGWAARKRARPEMGDDL